MADDPAEYPFTDEIVFHGGSYTVFTGPNADIANQIRWLLKAIVQRQDPELNPVFRREVTSIAMFVLRLADHIAERAGVSRYAEPSDNKSKDIEVPQAGVINDLASCVVFSDADMDGFCSAGSSGGDPLPPFVTECGSFDLSGFSSESGALHSAPIVKCGDQFTVPVPSSLLPALRHRILCLAQDRGVLSQLSEAFRDAVWDHVLVLLDRWGNRAIPLKLPDPSPTRFVEQICGLDSDKALYVQLATDDLVDFDPERVFGSWNSTGLAEEMQARANAVAEQLLGMSNGPTSVLILTLTQQLGRFSVFGFSEPQPGARLLAMGVSDLDTMAALDSGDPLALWKFAQASHAIRQRTGIFSQGLLDEYQLYRSRQHSYYWYDERLPEMIMIAVGTALAARMDAARLRDSHGVSSLQPNSLAEVWSLFGSSVPIYSPPHELGNRPAMVVEGELPLSVWVVGAPDLEGQLYGFTALLVDCIAYWLWQFTPLVQESLNQRAEHVRRLVVHIDYRSRGAWDEFLSNTRQPDPGTDELVTVNHSSPDDAEIHFWIEPTLLSHLARADNEGERILIQQVLSGLREEFSEAFSDMHSALSSAAIDEATERFAPLGQKKKLILLSTARRPELDPTGLPAFRSVQETEYAYILDGVGEHIASRGFQQGALEGADRTRAVNAAVAWMFNELENLVGSVSDDELLPSLIAFHEAATREMFSRVLTIPTRLHCFGDRQSLVAQLSEEMPDAYITNSASRFLIEYVAARPPRGDQHMSLENYDRMLALAAEIIQWGNLSDMIKYEIADIPTEILPSGRLGRDETKLTAARSAFLAKHMSGQIGRTSRAFNLHWRAPEADERTQDIPADLRDLDQAVSKEFGFGLVESVGIMGTLLELVADQHDAVKRVPKARLIAALSDHLSWSEEQAERALSQLTLAPRSSYFDNEIPKTDLYPWVFNRSHSHIRRPLVSREESGNVVLYWGNRHVVHWSRYFFELCTTGRIKATSEELVRLIGRRRDLESKAFETHVADIFATSLGRENVRLRAKKFAGARLLGGDGNDLGDVDVLAADRRHRTIVTLECKDFEQARTPREISNELRGLFKGTEGDEATTAKHLRRVEWLTQNLESVTREMNLDSAVDWSVKAALITDVELFSPHISESPFPVHAIEEILHSGVDRFIAEIS
ncbi:MAG: hypothetical protein WD333_02205 [Dehalococcoidia bacterium]